MTDEKMDKNDSIPSIGNNKKVSMSVPWLEKYRPKNLDDIVGNNETINRLKIIGKYGNMPNIILCGPPGIGKTTSIYCLANKLFNNNKELIKKGVLELNASDDRGIDIIRNKIKLFAKQKITLPNNTHKIIILDEFDNITVSAQQGLRRIIEIYSKTTRFALSCNISNKIIEPIQSRFAILRYNKLTNNDILYNINKIIKNESINNYTKNGLNSILFISNGDMRIAINALQSTFIGFNIINEKNVYKICDIPNPSNINNILNNIIKLNIKQSILLLNNIINKGYSNIDIIQTLFKCIKIYNNNNINDLIKLEWIKLIGFTHANIANGLQSKLQLTSLLAKMILVVKQYNHN